MPTGGQPGMAPGRPAMYQQGPPPPGALPPAPPKEEPVFPPDAMGATQNLNAVPGPGAAAAARPLYRDEVPEDAGADTAQFDVQSAAYDDYDNYDDDGYDDRRSSGSTKRNVLMGIGFAVLLLVVGGGVFLFASGGLGGGDGNATTVADEGSDPGGLAPEALFPEEVEIEGQGTFTRVAVDDTEDCASGTHGDYGEVLGSNECRQLVRASYLSEDQNHAVTVGVAAMPGDTEAEEALSAQDLVGAQWFAGLPGEEGSPAERLGYSGGHGSSGQWGRYLLFSLSANSDGSGDEETDATELRDIGDGFIDAAYDKLVEDRS